MYRSVITCNVVFSFALHCIVIYFPAHRQILHLPFLRSTLPTCSMGEFRCSVLLYSFVRCPVLVGRVIRLRILFTSTKIYFVGLTKTHLLNRSVLILTRSKSGVQWNVLFLATLLCSVVRFSFLCPYVAFLALSFCVLLCCVAYIGRRFCIPPFQQVSTRCLIFKVHLLR